MIKIANLCTPGPRVYETVAKGIRHSYNSEEKSDTFGIEYFGEKDLELAKKLISTNNRSHCKFLRQIPIIFEVTAPIYWWKEFDTYKIGVTRNSSSTMHTVTKKLFELKDFSLEKLDPHGTDMFNDYILETLNRYRSQFIETNNKAIWYAIIQLLPESYNQLSTVSMNYEVLHKIYIDRRNHKLDEWQVFCDWIKDNVPLSELII